MASLPASFPAKSTASEGHGEDGVAGGGGHGGGGGIGGGGGGGGADALSGAASGGGAAAGGRGGGDRYAAAWEIVAQRINEWSDSNLQHGVNTKVGARKLREWAAGIGEDFHANFGRKLSWLFGLPWERGHLEEQALVLFPKVFKGVKQEHHKQLASVAAEWMLTLSKALRRELVRSQLAVLHVNDDVTQPLDIAKVLAWLKGLETFGIDVPTLGTAFSRNRVRDGITTALRHNVGHACSAESVLSHIWSMVEPLMALEGVPEVVSGTKVDPKSNFRRWDDRWSQTPIFPDFYVETRVPHDKPPTLLWCFESKTYDNYQHHLQDPPHHQQRQWQPNEVSKDQCRDPRVQILERFLKCRCDLQVGFAMFSVGAPLYKNRQSRLSEDGGRLPEHMVAGFMLLHIQGEPDDRSVTPHFLCEEHSNNFKEHVDGWDYAGYKSARVLLNDTEQVEELINRMVKTVMLVQHQLLLRRAALASEHK